MASVAVNEKPLDTPEAEVKTHKKPKKTSKTSESETKPADSVIEDTPPEISSPSGSASPKKSRTSPEIDPRIVALERQILEKESYFQKLEEKAAKAQEAYEREAKAKKELEALYAKLLAEKTDLLSTLEGEKGSLSETQERAAKLQAQKSDLESQLSVSIFFCSYFPTVKRMFILTGTRKFTA